MEKIHDAQVAYNASSGGATRTILKYALERSLCQTVYCLTKMKSYPWAEGSYLKRPMDLNAVANSMYLPVLANKNLNRALPKGTQIVVGTNCQLLGIDGLYRKESHRIFKIALLCKQQKTYEFTQHIARQINSKIQSNSTVRYRGNGWPGIIRVANKSIPHLDAAYLPYSKQLWMVPGCRFCGHLFGTNADLTVADPWGIEKGEEHGKTTIIARTNKGLDLLNKLQDLFTLKAIDIETLKTSIEWSNYKKKMVRMDVYSKNKVSSRTRLLVKFSDHQRHFLEYLLNHFTFPLLVLKILARLPLADEWTKK